LARFAFELTLPARGANVVWDPMDRANLKDSAVEEEEFEPQVPLHGKVGLLRAG
jgi:hypothetical protein